MGCSDKIKYTIEIHKAIFTEEFFEVYKKYELAVHKKERTPDQVLRFLCNSPVFDPRKE
jgi:arginyl-tRNA--protein-N-Asp/Glu arginylyltransferase